MIKLLHFSFEVDLSVNLVGRVVECKCWDIKEAKNERNRCLME